MLIKPKSHRWPLLATGLLTLLATTQPGHAQGRLSTDGQELTLSAIDVVAGANLGGVVDARLRRVDGETDQWELVDFNLIKRPGGQRGKLDVITGLAELTVFDATGQGSLALQLALLPNTNPMRFAEIQRHAQPDAMAFNRIATFPVYRNSSIEDEAAAEIVAASVDGNTLVYTDSSNNRLGFVDISQATDPQPLGILALPGEPTSVAVHGAYALAAVNTSASFTNPSGRLEIVDIASRALVAGFDLNGQPDAVSVSPDGRFAAIAIENERNEDLNDGALPQLPAGSLVIVDLNGEPAQWTLRNVSLTGLADIAPEDPEPEFVSINAENIAAVSLQENNHIILVDLPSGLVTSHFSAGLVDLTEIDTQEESPAQIELTDSLRDIPREPDGLVWLDNNLLATANEGDFNGGSRGFTVFNRNGAVVYDSGNALEHDAVRHGHYPDDRSGNKGNEPENVEFARFGDDEYLFIASERSSAVFVKNLTRNTRQFLPTGVSPEGIKAIPGRDLFVAATELDDRGNAIRGGLSIFQRQAGAPTYPTLLSEDRITGTPIPWSALSGLAADRTRSDLAYSVPDSFYQRSRIFVLNIDNHPARLSREIVLYDNQGVLAGIEPDQVNSDNTVNLDLEGIATSADGGFWLVSEGAGTVGDDNRPVTSRNLVLHITAQGVIDRVFTLPDSTNARQVRFGFEGVAATGTAGAEVLTITFQREWIEDPDNAVRIGRLNTGNGAWTFYYYPLDSVTSPNGGWIGLSDITALNDDTFIVLERDNQGNDDARVKRLYQISLSNIRASEPDTPVGVRPFFPVLRKNLVRDLLPDLTAPGGAVLEKLEGLTITQSGDVLIVNDNDGVDDSNGETQLINLGPLFR
ncbi:MAG: esterase-like activity of phytase family protein [Methylococcales bacterium]|nr:esterase-like activity of phytase family protein [Methylococcales bacterium]